MRNTMSTTAIIVPCRLESTRFPRKLLHPIKGKPLLLWVAQRIAAEAPEFPLYFAVDHERLRDAVAPHGFQVIMTSPAHASGTDRLARELEVRRLDSLFLDVENSIAHSADEMKVLLFVCVEMQLSVR